LAENGHGVLTAQSQAVSAKGKSGDYSATVALTPNWWVGGGEFKVVWYAGLSQTKRFFQISAETGKPADKPAWIANPEVGVREVKVAFDGGLPASVKPTTARAAFPIPAGAKAVTRIEVLYGPADKPLSYLWK